MQIEFNKPCVTGNEKKYVLSSLKSQHISGDGPFTKKCHQWFENKLKCEKVLLTTSCTHALEMAAILLNIQPGDEVIMPSYTFVSTANAFVLRGAEIVFVDIDPNSMNIDVSKIENAITNKTKAIIPVHYAGVSCDMDLIMKIANRHNLIVIEDAAQAIMGKYKNKYLGTIGHMGTYSFHETKNITSAGEGGLLIINDNRFSQRAEIIREKGTNRSAFFRGSVDKYSWVDIGSSYLLNDVSAAYLFGNLEFSSKITNKRLKKWELYYTELEDLAIKKLIELPNIPMYCEHNAHIFYIKLANIHIRTQLILYLKKKNINTVFHYIPLHTSVAGQMHTRFKGEDIYTTKESERLLRLPLYYQLKKKDIQKIVKEIYEFFKIYK